MRLIFGIVLGVALTIGAAYVHDSRLTGPFQVGQQLVNWEAAGSLARSAYDRVRAEVRRLTG
jgi:hypothetical protein